MEGLNATKTLPILLLSGADPNLRDHMERTAYEVAVAYERWECADLLREQPYAKPEAMQYYRDNIQKEHKLDLAKYSQDFIMLKEGTSSISTTKGPKPNPYADFLVPQVRIPPVVVSISFFFHSERGESRGPICCFGSSCSC